MIATVVNMIKQEQCNVFVFDFLFILHSYTARNQNEFHYNLIIHFPQSWSDNKVLPICFANFHLSIWNVAAHKSITLENMIQKIVKQKVKCADKKTIRLGNKFNSIIIQSVRGKKMSNKIFTIDFMCLRLMLFCIQPVFLQKILRYNVLK